MMLSLHGTLWYATKFLLKDTLHLEIMIFHNHKIYYYILYCMKMENYIHIVCKKRYCAIILTLIMIMDLYGVGYVLVTWSSCLKKCVYPLVWWFCSFALWSCVVRRCSGWMSSGILVTWRNTLDLDYRMECLCWIHGFSP